MKRLLIILLVGSAAIDIARRAYTIDLIGSIQKRSDDTSVLTALSDSPIMATIGHWSLFLIGFGLLSLAMSSRKPIKPNTLDRPRS